MWAQKAGKLLSAAGKQEEVGMGPKLTGKETLKVQPRVLLEQLPPCQMGQQIRGHPSPQPRQGLKVPCPLSMHLQRGQHLSLGGWTPNRA